MKLGIVSATFRDMSWEEACKKVKDLGLQAIEPSAGGYDGSEHCDPLEMLKNDGSIKKFKKTAGKYGLEISELNCKGNPLHPDKGISEEYISALNAAMELASKIGVKTVCVFAGLPGAAKDAKYPNWITSPWPFFFSKALKWQWEEKTIPFWMKMAKKAKNLGVRLAFEMEPGDMVYNTETFLKLQEAIGTEEITVNLDPGHLFYQGIDMDVCIRKLGKAIVHVHIKDASIARSVVDYTGIIDAKMFNELSTRAWNYATVGYGHDFSFWKNFIYTLRLVGYKGVLSIENENTNMSASEGIQKSVEFMKKCMLFEEVTTQWWDDYISGDKE